MKNPLAVKGLSGSASQGDGLGSTALGLSLIHISSVHLFDGIPDALARLKAGGLRLAVVSSNSLENVQRVLGPDTAALFDDYECGTDLFGKAAKIDRLLQRHGTPPERFLLVGDEMRDIDAARKAGVRVGSVAWGYNHEMCIRDRNSTLG